MQRSSLIASYVLLAVLAAGASQESLFPLGPYGRGGHGGPFFGLTTLNGRPAVLGGGLLGVSVNPGFSWIAEARYLEADFEDLDFGYGAIGTEATYRVRKLVQPMGLFLVGFGRANHEGRDAIALVGEVAGMVGFQVGPGEKIILGLAYREVEIPGDPGFPASAFDGWNLTARVDYGIFDADPASVARTDARSVAFSGYYTGKWTLINGHWAWMDGAGTTVILGRNLVLGAGGYQMRNAFAYGEGDFSLGYGGMLGRYLVRPMDRWHGSFTLLGGLGRAGAGNSSTGETTYGSLAVLDGDALLELNVTEFLRLGLGAGYRLVPMDFESLGPGDLGGPSLIFQLGTGAF